jgi:hypothetical protein
LWLRGNCGGRAGKHLLAIMENSPRLIDVAIQPSQQFARITIKCGQINLGAFREPVYL